MGRWSNLTNIFQMGWFNLQLEKIGSSGWLRHADLPMAVQFFETYQSRLNLAPTIVFKLELQQQLLKNNPLKYISVFHNSPNFSGVTNHPPIRRNPEAISLDSAVASLSGAQANCPLGNPVTGPTRWRFGPSLRNAGFFGSIQGCENLRVVATQIVLCPEKLGGYMIPNLTIA